MPTRTTRTTTSRPRRTTSAPSTRRGTSARRGSTARRGVAGGWLQRRHPEPKGVKKVLSKMPTGKGGIAAAGLALVGAAGVALRKRGNDNGSHASTPTRVDTNPPVSGPPTSTVTTPPNTTAVTPEPPRAA